MLTGTQKQKERTIENLNLLADFLKDENNVKEEEFCMLNFRSETREGKELSRKDYAERNICDTAGCALGWAPFIKGLEIVNREYDKGFKSVDWVDYSERIFPALTDKEWEWLFSGQWTRHDNTPKGASKRIRFFLMKGTPKDWSDNYNEGKYMKQCVKLYNKYVEG